MNFQQSCWSIAGVICKPLIHIFNLCISSGIFPSRWKMARVISLNIKGDKFNVNDYHPIAVLLLLSKVFERIFKERISNYLDQIMFFFLPNTSLDLGQAVRQNTELQLLY